MVDAMRGLALDAELRAVQALLPDNRNALHQAGQRCDSLRRAIDQLCDGRGHAATSTISQAGTALRDATREPNWIEHRLKSSGVGWLDRRQVRTDLAQANDRVTGLAERLDTLTAGPLAELYRQLEQATATLEDMTLRHDTAATWLREHPEVADRLNAIANERALLDTPRLDRQLDYAITRSELHGPEPGLDHGHARPGPDEGMSLGL